MKDIYDMQIGESFYLKETVAVISKRTGRPCEYDEERIDINDLIIEELETVKTELKAESDFTGAGHLVVEWETIEKVIGNRISELKGE